MITQDFPEANIDFGPPADFGESQIMTVRACKCLVKGGSLDGAMQVIVAWKPTEEELKRLVDGGLLYITMLGGGLAPHYPSTTFHQASHPI